ncbi:MAG: hypothetical protein WAX69_09955 [Victivallales bacterium]
MTTYGRIGTLAFLTLFLAFDLGADQDNTRVFATDVTLTEDVRLDGRPEGLTTTWVIKPGVTVTMDSISGGQLLTALMYNLKGPAYFVVTGGGVLYSKRVKEFGIRLGHGMSVDGKTLAGSCTLIIEGGSTARFATEITVFPTGGFINLKDAGSELQFLASTPIGSALDEQGSILKVRPLYGSNGRIPITINGAPIKLKGPDANSTFSISRIDGVIYRCLKVLPAKQVQEP